MFVLVQRERHAAQTIKLASVPGPAEPTRALATGPRHRARRHAERGHPRTGHSHSHSHAVPALAPRRTRLILALLLVPALLATIVGLIVLWPDTSAVPHRIPALLEGAEQVVVTVVGPRDDPTNTVPVRLDDGTVSSMDGPERAIALEPGDRVVAVSTEYDGDRWAPYAFVDFERHVPLLLLVGVFALLVLLVARWRGSRRSPGS